MGIQRFHTFSNLTYPNLIPGKGVKSLNFWIPRFPGFRPAGHFSFNKSFQITKDPSGTLGLPPETKVDPLPKVTITYADHLDLEESVMNVSEKENTVLANGLESHPKQNGGGSTKKSKEYQKRLAQIISPMEVIEECSIENSQSVVEPISHQTGTPVTSNFS